MPDNLYRHNDPRTGRDHYRTGTRNAESKENDNDQNLPLLWAIRTIRGAALQRTRRE